MGIKAFVQKGRSKPGLILPAAATARVNQAKDRSALVREYERRQRSVSAVETLPDPKPEATPDPTPEPVQEDPTPNTIDVDAPLPEDDTTVPDSVPSTTNNLDNLTQLSGVGPALQRRLRSFGFTSIEKLAKADPTALNMIQGAKGRGDMWVAEARRLLDA